VDCPGGNDGEECRYCADEGVEDGKLTCCEELQCNKRGDSMEEAYCKCGNKDAVECAQYVGMDEGGVRVVHWKDLYHLRHDLVFTLQHDVEQRDEDK